MRKTYLKRAMAALLSMSLITAPVLPSVFNPTMQDVQAASTLSITGWSGADVTNNSNGSCTVKYAGKYQTAVYNVPASIDASLIQSVTLNVSADSQFCIKLCDSEGTAFKTDYPGYGLSSEETDNYTYQVDASTNTLSQIQIMSLSEQSVTINAIDITVKQSGEAEDNGISLSTITGWDGAEVTHNADGTCTVAYSGKYNTAVFKTDSSIDATKLQSVKLNITANSQFCIKLCDSEGTAFTTEYPGYELPDEATQDYTYRIDASENTLAQIQIMSLSEQSITINSIQFAYAQAANPDDGNYDQSLSSLAAKFGFKFGTNISHSTLSDSAYKKLVVKNFNSVTASNEMKAYSLLSQSASKSNSNGMPVMNYSQADDMMQYAADNGIAVRGHALVWHANMCDWFFRVGYDTNNAYVDAATAKARLQYYINDVVTHFETKFPGVIYCWDVVNEAVDTSNVLVSGDSRCIENNIFSKIIGKDFVELSFKYAKEAVNKMEAQNSKTDIKLFYNDFSTFYTEKRDAICNLVKSLNAYEKDANGNYIKLCDGVGMQSYIGGFGKQSGCMNSGDISLIKSAIKKFHALGVEVHVTEMAVRNYQNDAATVAKHAQFYQDLFAMYLSLNSSSDCPLTSVSIWGLCYNPSFATWDYGYKMNGPYCGLFDENLNMKDSFKKVYSIMNSTAATVTTSPSVSPSPSITPSPSVTPSESVSPSPSATPSESVSPSPSATPSESVSPSPSATPSESVSPSPSATPSESVSPSPSATPSESVSPSPSQSTSESALSFEPSLNSWDGGYVMNITLKNISKEAITEWTLYLDSSEVKITNLWCGQTKESGSKYVITPFDYNKTLSPSGACTLGFNGNGTCASSLHYKLVYTANGVEHTYEGVK